MYQLPSKSLDYSTAATTGATHDATPSHANPTRHKHSGVDRSIGRLVDRKNTHNQTPSPSTPKLVERQGQKAVPRLRMPEGLCDALCVSPLQGSRQCHSDKRRALPKNQDE